MKVWAMDFFLCPRCCAGKLKLEAYEPLEKDGEINLGDLVCSRCSSVFPIANGIPRFAATQDYAGSFGFQWNKFRKTQLDSHTGRPLSKARLFHVTRWAENLDGHVVLEAGSGAGRFTEVLLETNARVFSFDLSTAVEANRQNNGTRANLALFQASIYDIPCPPATFDKVICLGVLQHTPDPLRAFNNLVRYVKPGGDIAVDIYARRLTSVLAWKYVLRPLTKLLPKETLFRLVVAAVNALLPVSVFLQKLFGRYGVRLLPIVQYSHLGLPKELNREWAILDTFDMYSPEHDHPRSLDDVRRWFKDAGLEHIVVEYGPNGVIGRGRRALSG